MGDDLFRAVAVVVILYAVYHVATLVRNVIRESRKRRKNKPPRDA